MSATTEPGSPSTGNRQRPLTPGEISRAHREQEFLRLSPPFQDRYLNISSVWRDFVKDFDRCSKESGAWLREWLKYHSMSASSHLEDMVMLNGKFISHAEYSSCVGVFPEIRRILRSERKEEVEQCLREAGEIASGNSLLMFTHSIVDKLLHTIEGSEQSSIGDSDAVALATCVVAAKCVKQCLDGLARPLQQYVFNSSNVKKHVRDDLTNNPENDPWIPTIIPMSYRFKREAGFDPKPGHGAPLTHTILGEQRSADWPYDVEGYPRTRPPTMGPNGEMQWPDQLDEDQGTTEGGA